MQHWILTKSVNPHCLFTSVSTHCLMLGWQINTGSEHFQGNDWLSFSFIHSAKYMDMENAAALFLTQLPQLLQWLLLWHFLSMDNSSPSHGMSLHWVWVEQLIHTLSTSLVLMTSVEISTHSRGLVVGPAPIHVQDGHQLVKSIPLQCKPPTVVGT